MKTSGNSLTSHLISVLLILVLILITGCNKDDDANLLIDHRDGQAYKTMKIGTQTWMVENLNYDPPSGNSWCYNGDPEQCKTYGRLYDWETALAIAPEGWHLPTDLEYGVLIEYLGGEDIAGGKLKEAGLNHWIAPNTGASNESGFGAIPGGFYSTINNNYHDLGYIGYWWAATEYEIQPDDAYILYLNYSLEQAYRSFFPQEDGVAVRCLKD